jgi:hypothetical protein
VGLRGKGDLGGGLGDRGVQARMFGFG